MPRLLSLLLLLPLLGLVSLTPAAAAGPPLRAGAATSNITPELGLKIVGGFLPYPATGVHDELHARCLVVDDGRAQVALVVCDLLGLHRSVSLEARRLITEATGIPPEHVVISGTHTHSAASALGENRYVNEQPLDAYQRFVARRIADGVRRAVNHLRPAEMAFGTVEAPEHVFNRRWFMKEGTAPPNPFGKVDRVKMNPPGGSPNLLEPAGPVDPVLSFLAFREPGGPLISLYAAYSLHYVGGVAGGDVSADYFGLFCEELARLQPAGREAPPFVPMLANGTSGDINNINFLKPRKGSPPYTRMREVAHDLAGRVHAALAGCAWEREATVAARYRELPLAWRTIDPALLAWAREKNPSPASPPIKADLPTLYAGRVQRLAEARGPALVPLQAVRLGGVVIGTFPCETFAETGLEFRRRSPVKQAFMVELNHAYLGYLPTPRHFPLGGYETWPGTNSLEPEAAVKMLDALLEMVAEITPAPAAAR